MSDRIPQFKFGDRVRVMQTTEMEVRGLANRRGTVMQDNKTVSQRIRVALDKTETQCQENVAISPNSLMPIK